MMTKLLTKGTFRGAIHCRHCRQPHVKGLRRPNHGNLEKLELEVIETIKHGLELNLIESFGIQKESLAMHFNVPVHQISRIFQNLNRKGYLSQPIHKAPHDSTRDRWGGHDSAWMGSYYLVHESKFIQPPDITEKVQQACRLQP